MADVPSSSFIPKRNSGQTARRNRGQNFFILAIISYACLIAAPTASAAVFVYGIYAERQFQQAVISLEAEIAEFAEADMRHVIEFDARLTSAMDLLDAHVSVNKVFDHLESFTIDTVGFSELSIKRTATGGLQAEGTARADSLDSAYFQRTVYDRDVMVGTSVIADVVFTPTESDSSYIEFTGTYDFAPEDVRFEPVNQPNAETGSVSTDATESLFIPGDTNDGAGFTTSGASDINI